MGAGFKRYFVQNDPGKPSDHNIIIAIGLYLAANDRLRVALAEARRRFMNHAWI
ncbi:hypothetical protein [Xylanibacillus composti]|uniref:Uncharacterized protein n=1 Tax=Xylanibacillus composti TaxID=1572762 RepID=A0A8J4H260_9BACL|nr:hypothetical protein [Xylanibacillus composti]GIQ68051.1 hypothetical protein XYCOK13_08750 [Xylanibacillus composti]